MSQALAIGVRWIWIGIAFLLCVSAKAADLASVANNPFALLRFVNAQGELEWEPLWKALRIPGSALLPDCERTFRGKTACSAAFIGPLQTSHVVIVLKHKSSGFELFLRYQRKSDRWEFSGSYAPSVKYFSPSAGIVSSGLQTFLVVTGQGNAGTGLSSKVESWLEFKLPEFKPVLSFTAEGVKDPWGDSLGRRVHGSVARLPAGPEQRLAVAMTIDFSVANRDHQEVSLCRRRDLLVYHRSGSGEFQLDSHASSATADQVRKFYDDLDSDLSDQEFLAFNRTGLVLLASQGDETSRAWLSRFLQRLPDSKEVVALKRGLAR